MEDGHADSLQIANNVSSRLFHARRHAPVLYSTFIEAELPWPSNSIEFLPGSVLGWPPGADSVGTAPQGWATASLLLGTQTSGLEACELQVAQVLLPNPGVGVDGSDMSDSAKQQLPPVYRCVARFPHQGDVDRARAMPQDPSIVATKSVGSGLYIYNIGSSASGFGQDLQGQQQLGSSEGESDEDDVDAMDEDDSSSQQGQGASNQGSGDESEASDGDEPAVEFGNGARQQLPGLGPGPIASLTCAPAPRSFGLAWSHVERGRLLSTSEGGKVIVWRVDALHSSSSLSNGGGAAAAGGISSGASGGSAGSAAPPVSLTVIDAHPQGVNDVAVAWGPNADPHLFVTAGDEGGWALWDMRLLGTRGACVARMEAAHRGPCNSVALSSLRPHALASCSDDGAVKVWDLRSCCTTANGAGPSTSSQASVAAQPVLKLKSHRCEVLQVAWSPHAASALASSDAQGRVYLWDVDRGEGEAGDVFKRPQLRYIHATHASPVSDLSWSPDVPGLLASTSPSFAVPPQQGDELPEDEAEAIERGAPPDGGGDEKPVQTNVLQVWQPSADLYSL